MRYSVASFGRKEAGGDDARSRIKRGRTVFESAETARENPGKRGVAREQMAEVRPALDGHPPTVCVPCP